MKLAGIALAILGAACATSTPAHPRAARAHRAAAPAVAKTDAPASPAAPAVTTPPPPRPRLTFAAARTAADSALRAFATTTWSDATAPAAQAVLALSDLVDASGGCRAASDPSEGVVAMRRQAQLMLADAKASFGDPARVRVALVAALDAVAPDAAGRAGAGEWIEAARSSAKQIGDSAMMAFARASLQDALRATFGAVVSTCAPVAPAAAPAPTPAPAG